MKCLYACFFMKPVLIEAFGNGELEKSDENWKSLS